MLREQLQDFTLQAPIFHDLARQFQKIPEYIYPRQTRVVDIAQHCMQAMAELME